ncbi:MAG: gamma subclass chorismate mutase AroQ [Pseudomonadales bacterium]|nr:gamma subclass chorismate mutase AroQ [Pseudomonadales bacterium]
MRIHSKQISILHSFIVLSGLLLTPLSFAAASEQREAALELFDLINQRLSYMEDVALYKAQRNLPIEDKEREAVVIANAAQSAAMSGIEVTSAEQFFATQIEMAKFIQWQVLEMHTAQQIEAAAPRDLAEEIRPALNGLGDAMLESIGDYLESFGPVAADHRALFDQQIDNEYLQSDQKRILFDALGRLRLEEKFN